MYQPKQALEIVKTSAFAKFDETVEVAVRLGVDPRHADQIVRGTVVLPAGTGKSVRVLVVAVGDKAREAEAAGADFVGAEHIAKIKEGWLDFDVMCPIETPEGPNIGLITSLACFARVNDLGFVETPYRVVKNGKVTDEIAWLDANREEDVTIAQANAKLNPDGSFVDEFVLCRQRADYPVLPPDRIDYMGSCSDSRRSASSSRRMVAVAGS